LKLFSVAFISVSYLAGQVLVDATKCVSIVIAVSIVTAPVKWPSVMSRNARDSLARGGSPTISTEVFPKNENGGAQLDSFKSTANW